MYIPKPFEMTHKPTLVEFIREYSIGILFSGADGDMLASHLPMLYDAEREVLFGHMAYPNDQWRRACGQRVMAVFHGPHAYISSRWYDERNTVPTWNYAAVHLYGSLSLVEEEERILAVMDETIRFYDPELHAGWRDWLDEQMLSRLLQGIAVFEVRIDKWEGKWKLSQNHLAERREKVIKALSRQPSTGAGWEAGIAELMRRHP